MTLILAIPGPGEVVVAADTYIFKDYAQAYYASSGRKIWKAGKWLIGVAGSELGRAVLDKLELHGFNYANKFDSVCDELAEKVFTFAAKETSSFSVMVCGVEGGRSRIKEWQSSSNVPIDGSDRPTAIGARYHGGIYLAYQHYGLQLSTEQRILLAYYCVDAVSTQDLRVRPPIHVAVVKEDGATIYSGEQLSEFALRSKAISESLKQEFLKAGPQITSEGSPPGG